MAKKRKSNNPLSDARKSQSFYETLWNKKSGLGYSLFVQYYGQQPAGVVVEDICTGTTMHTSDEWSAPQVSVSPSAGAAATTTAPASINHTTKTVHAGMSRAAKRRRKKNGNIPVAVTTVTATTNPSTTSGSNGSSLTTVTRKEVPKHLSNNGITNVTTNDGAGNHRSRLQLELDTHRPRFDHLEEFVTALSKPLPLTFRIRNYHVGCNNIKTNNKEDEDDENTTSAAQQQQQQQQQHQQETERMKLLHEIGKLSDWVVPVPYDKNIYQAIANNSISTTVSPNPTSTTTTTTILHKGSVSRLCPALKDVLIRGAATGVLARQELGSMLPILGLHRGNHLRPHHRVLDMCASPGSKTLQALEIVVGGVTTKNNNNKGRVLANDIHPKRLETLQDAVKRSGMEYLDRIVFTNYDASTYPLPKRSSGAPHVVVADVPCSGDGTIRKDRTVVPSWSPSTARALHDLQVRILVRALQVVRVGGVVSYSTCSLNPIENEAVVQAALLSASNSSSAMSSSSSRQRPPVELIEWPKLEGLVLRPGVSDWKVLDYHHHQRPTPQDDEKSEEGSNRGDANLVAGDVAANEDDDTESSWLEYATYEEAILNKMQHCYPTLWPHDKTENITTSIKDETSTVTSMQLNLHYCCRLWPQDQDTGGFFVALLRKNAEF
jgi:16S rRNA C967 or C1407 C5-methylase (RsmB/RsmF family)